MAIRVNGRPDNPIAIGYGGSDVKELYYGGKLIWPAEIEDITGASITVVVRLNLNQTSAGTWTYNWTTNVAIPSNKAVSVVVSGGSSSTTLSLTGDGVSTPTSLGLTTNIGTAVLYSKTESSWTDDNQNTCTTQTTVNVTTVSAQTINVPFQLAQQSDGYWAYTYSTVIPVPNSVTMSINGTSFVVTGATGTTVTTVRTEPGTAPSSTGITGGTYYVQADNIVYTINPSISSVKPYDNTPYLSISPTFISVGYEGYDSQPITIQCNTSWTVTYSDTWIQNSLYPSGTGNGSTYLYATRNDGGERSGVITVTCAGGLSKSCIIYQAAAPALALSSGNYFYFNQPYTGRTISDTVVLTGDTMWEVSSANGISITPSRGANGTNVQIKLPANASTSETLFCYAYIRLVNNTSVTQTIGAYINPSEVVASPSISVSANNTSIDWNQGSTTVIVTANTTWQVDSNLLSGITTSQCSPLSGGSGTTAVTISNLPNNTSYVNGVSYRFGATTTMAGATNVSDSCEFSKSARPDNRPVPSITITSNPTNIVWSGTTYEITITVNVEDSTPWSISLYRNGTLYSGIEDPEGGRDTFSTLDGAGNMVLTIHTNQNTSTSSNVRWLVTGETTYGSSEIKDGETNKSASCITTQGKRATPAPSKYAKFVVTDYTFPATGETSHTFTITANTDWAIYQDQITGSDPEDPACFTVEGLETQGEITGSSGSKTIRITAPAYNGEGSTLDERYMIIPIFPLNMDEFNTTGYNTLTLYQNEKPYITQRDGSTASASTYSGATISKSFDTNAPWTASSLGWATMSPAQGPAGSNTVNININANTEYTQKTGNITVTTTAVSPNLPNASAIYNVSLPAKVDPPITPTLTVSPASTSITASYNSVEYTLSTNTTWSASSNASWARIQSTTGSAGNSQAITVSCDANTGETSRTATITFRTTYSSNNVTSAVTITQAYSRNYASFTCESVRVTNNVTAVTMAISANTSWVLDCDATMTPSRSSGGAGLSRIRFTFAENTSSFNTKIMRCAIELANDEDTNYGKFLTATIYQSAKDYTDIVNEVTYTFLVDYINSDFKYYIFESNPTPTGPIANYEECPMPCIHYGNVAVEERQALSPKINSVSGATSRYVVNTGHYYMIVYNTLTNTWSNWSNAFEWRDAENILIPIDV